MKSRFHMHGTYTSLVQKLFRLDAVNGAVYWKVSSTQSVEIGDIAATKEGEGRSLKRMDVSGQSKPATKVRNQGVQNQPFFGTENGSSGPPGNQWGMSNFLKVSLQAAIDSLHNQGWSRMPTLLLIRGKPNSELCEQIFHHRFTTQGRAMLLG